MKVLILGCGPSGLLAAEACKQNGHRVMIISQKAEPSPIAGAQYVHEAIPGVTNEEPDGMVHFHKTGTARGYAEKVYGDPDAPTSWDQFPVGEYPCWSMMDVYQKLWKEWYDSIREARITPETANLMLDYGQDKIDLVISSIPAYHICNKLEEHQFPSAKIQLSPVLKALPNEPENNYIYYNGESIDNWYRASWIFGAGWFEYGQMSPPDHIHDLVTGIKPLDTDCDCQPHIVRVGRFGEWKKGKLIHHAYRKTLDTLEVMDALHNV